MTDDKVIDSKTIGNDEVLQKIKQNNAARVKKEALKELIALIIIICIFASIFLYIVFKIYMRGKTDLTYLNNVNKATLQISQLVDSIRMVQTIYPEDKVVTVERLVNIGAIPDILLKKGGQGLSMVNPFGGRILIEPSTPLKSEDKMRETPTFKIVYQGLPHKACVDLAIMDWGDKLKGLQAVAVGSLDRYTGEDTALQAIDEEVKKVKPEVGVDKKGRRRHFRPRMQMGMNVAKPNDKKLATPFPREVADIGCSCYRDNSCTFAVLYSIFSLEDEKDGAKK